MQETTPISIPSQDLPLSLSEAKRALLSAHPAGPGVLSQADSEGHAGKGSHGAGSAPKPAVPCSHRTRKGRPCQLPARDTGSGLCFRHSSLRVPKKDPEDFSDDLLKELTEFHTPHEVNEFLARLLFLLVRNRISPKRAGVLTYIAAQLLHSLGLVRLVEKDDPVQIILDGPRPGRSDAPKVS